MASTVIDQDRVQCHRPLIPTYEDRPEGSWTAREAKANTEDWCRLGFCRGPAFNKVQSVGEVRVDAVEEGKGGRRGGEGGGGEAYSRHGMGPMGQKYL